MVEHAAEHTVEHALDSSFESILGCNDWLLAYSGGVDSTVLLHAASRYLNKKRHSSRHRLPQLTAIHIDHQLSTNHRLWTEHCVQQCERLDIPVRTITVDVDQNSASLERAARKARYEAFALALSSCKGSTALLMAHHADDQVETVFLRLLRGTGVRGVSGMAEERVFSAEQMLAKIVRPLLGCSKSQLVEYASRHDLHWIDDESNVSDQFDRNYLRHKVLPVLFDRWPNLRRTLLRFSRLAGEAEQLSQDLAKIDFDDLLRVDSRFGAALSREALVSLPEYRRRNVYRFWFSQVLVQLPEEMQMRLIDAWLCAAESTGQYALADHSIRKYRDGVYLVDDECGINANTLNVLQFDWPLIDTQRGLSYAGVGEIVVGNSQRGLRAGRYTLCNRAYIKSVAGKVEPEIRINGNSKSLHKLMQEMGVPTWQRDSYPVVLADKKIAAIPPIVSDEFYSEGAVAVDWAKFDIPVNRNL